MAVAMDDDSGKESPDTAPAGTSPVTDSAERAEQQFQTARRICPQDPTQASELFHQAIMTAHRLGNQRRMGEYAIRAAEAMIGIGLLAEAEEFRQLIRAAADLSPAKREHILGSNDYVAAEIAYTRGAYDEARALFEKARQHWQIQGPPDAEYSVLMMLANIAGLQGDHETALTYYQQAYNLAEEQGDIRTKIVITYNLGWALEALGRWEDAVDCLERVLQDDAVQGRHETISDTCNCLGELYLHRNQLGQAIDFFRRAADELTRAPTPDTPSAYGDILANLGLAYQRQGNLTSARTTYQQALDRSIAAGDRRLQALVHSRLAELALDQHDLATARHHGDESLTLAQATGARPVEAGALLVLGRIFAAQEEPSQAAAAFDAAIELLADAEESYALATARFQYGCFRLAQNQTDAALELLEAAGRTFRKLRVVAEAVSTNRLLFKIALARDREQALLLGLTGLAGINLEPADFLAEALTLLCTALRFNNGIALQNGQVVAKHGGLDPVPAQRLGPFDIIDTAQIQSWPVIDGKKPVGRIHLEGPSEPLTAGSTLLITAVAGLLADGFNRLAAKKQLPH